VDRDLTVLVKKVELQMTGVADEQHMVPSIGSLETTRVPHAERRAQFEREVTAHLDGLYTFALKLARLPHDAEDLVSATFVRAFDRWEQYTLGTNARAWLFTILYHIFVNGRRIERREVLFSENDAESPRFEVVGDSDPERDFYESIVDDEVTRAIDSLPVHYREAVLLSDLHEFRYAEIAEILGIPEGTAKSRLFRGRRMLQRMLTRYAVEMGYVKPRAA
jgi:RNA polymerase sigma-70 factor (ECF subfamily)